MRLSILGPFAAVAFLVVGCSDNNSSPPSATSTATATATPTSVPTSTPHVIVFNGENNNLNAYDPANGFLKQNVVQSNAENPGVGRDSNGEICFTRDSQGVLHYILGEDTNQGTSHDTAGWGYFILTGTEVGQFQYQEVGKMIPTYQFTPDGAENYGCGFLSDGRLVTTDVGNQATGSGNGQLIIWFPPFDNGANYTDTGVVPNTPASYCKLDISIGTAGGIYIDSQDRVYLTSARVNPGVYRYSPPFPTGNDAEHGCGQTDDTGAPLADNVTKETFIASDANLPTPSAIARGPNGHFYVTSVLNGVIAEYDENGTFVSRVLQPASGDSLPYETGSPFGIGIDPITGTIYYADIGLVVGSGGVGPGNNTGSVRQLQIINGVPQPPVTMDTNLDFPDGIGILVE